MKNKKDIVRIKDFVELRFTGYVDGKVFDSNIPEDLKNLSDNAKPQKTFAVVGENMIIKGFDEALSGKEIGKEYRVEIPYKIGFGKRNRELVKTIPLKVFTEQKIRPQPGASFLLDNRLARIITISGARVLTDFNNPLAGKDLEYKFTILRKLTDIEEKTSVLFQYFFKFKPEFEISNKIIVKGSQTIENFVKQYDEKFKELLGLNLQFKLKVEKSKYSEKAPQ